MNNGYIGADIGSTAITPKIFLSQAPIRFRRQSGQVLMLGMALVLLAAFTMLATFNTGRVVNDKVQLVNAADAAAFSAAVVVARQLNFLAYTHRSMMANHLAVGHMVSYTSWVRALADLRQNNPAVITRLMTDFPELALTDEAIGKILGPGGDGVDNIAPLYIALTQSLMYSQTVAQVATYDALVNYDAVNGEKSLEQEAMEMIAGLHEMTVYQDPELIQTIHVNNTDHLDYIKSRVGARDEAVLDAVLLEINGQDDLIRNVLSYNALGDVDVIFDLAEKSIDALASRDWFRDRSWDQGWLQRQGSTSQLNLVTRLNWGANDQFETDDAGVIATVGQGSADADVLCREANGINSAFSCAVGYIGFAQRFSIAPAAPPLKLTAFLTKRMHDRFLDSDFYNAGLNQQGVGLNDNDENNRILMSALARSEVFYERPCGMTGCIWGFEAHAGEQPNLYNPFWQAHLSQ